MPAQIAGLEAAAPGMDGASSEQMRSTWLAIAAVAGGCSADPQDLGPIPADPLDPGAPTPACVECGPGAIRHGRELYGSLLVGPGDQVVRIVREHALWLDADFAVSDDYLLPAAASSYRIALDGEGTGVAMRQWQDQPVKPDPLGHPPPYHVELYGIDRGAAGPTFERPLDDNVDPTLAVGTDRIYVVSDSVIADPTAITVRSRTTAEVTATVGLPDPAFPRDHLRAGYTRVVPLPSGGAIIAGSFAGSLALGGTAPVLMSTRAGTGFIASVDANGVGRWAIALTADGDIHAGGGVLAITVDDAGNVGLAGTWTGTSATLGSTPLVSAGTSNMVIALLDPDGAVRWAHGFSGGEDVTGVGVTTDGTSVYVAGSFWSKPLGIDPAMQAPIDVDAFVAAIGATGASWVRVARGAGDQRISLAGHTSRGLIAYLESASVLGGEVALSYGDVTIEGEIRMFAELVAGP